MDRFFSVGGVLKLASLLFVLGVIGALLALIFVPDLLKGRREDDAMRINGDQRGLATGIEVVQPQGTPRPVEAGKVAPADVPPASAPPTAQRNPLIKR